MMTRLIRALDNLPEDFRPAVAFAATDRGEQFAVLQPPGTPDFGFCIRVDAAARYGWERWLTIRESTVRVRIASHAPELDGISLAVAAPKIAAISRDVGITSLIIHHAHGWSGAEPLTNLDGIRVVNLPDYPLALLARYGIEVIAGALAWIDFNARWCDQHGSMHEPLRPRPITMDYLRFLECHISHLQRDAFRRPHLPRAPSRGR